MYHSLSLSLCLFLGSQNMCVSAILRMFKCQRLCKLFLSSSVSNISGYDISMEIAIANKRTHSSDRASENERDIFASAHIWTGAQWNDKRPYIRYKPLYPSVFYASIHHFLFAFLGNIKRWREKILIIVNVCVCMRACVRAWVCWIHTYSDECLAIHCSKCNPITNLFLCTATELD